MNFEKAIARNYGYLIFNDLGEFLGQQVLTNEKVVDAYFVEKINELKEEIIYFDRMILKDTYCFSVKRSCHPLRWNFEKANREFDRCAGFHPSDSKEL